MPVQNKIFTAKARRTQRSYFLFGGEKPPNRKFSSHDKMHLFQCHSSARKPSLSLKGFALWSNRLSRLAHKQKNPFANLSGFAVNLILRETDILRKHQQNQIAAQGILPILDGNETNKPNDATTQ